MDPYPYIKAKYPGAVADLARAVLRAPSEDVYRVANDLHWLIAEVGRLRAAEEAHEMLLRTAYARRFAAWVDEVRDFLREIERAEENAWSQRGRVRCPFCGTRERDDDDGSWQHDDSCVAAGGHYLLMHEPLAASGQ